jgi:hypothetical protein
MNENKDILDMLNNIESVPKEDIINTAPIMATHCVRLNYHGGCTAYVYARCIGAKNCKAYATKEKVRSGIEKTYARIRTLPEISQRAIADRYYAGNMPWIL